MRSLFTCLQHQVRILNAATFLLLLLSCTDYFAAIDIGAIARFILQLERNDGNGIGN